MKALFSFPYFGVLLTVVAYWVGTKIQKKTGLVLCNFVPEMIINVIFGSVGHTVVHVVKKN